MNPRQKKDKADLLITALGGIDRVGGANCYLLETPEFNVMIDCGLALETAPTDSLFDDAIMEISYPNFENHKDKLEKVRTILITHGHLDHAGAIVRLWEIMQYCDRNSLPTVIAGKLTLKVLKKLWFEKYPHEGFPFPYRFIKPGKTIKMENLNVTPVRVPHSFPEAFGFYVEVAGRKIFYSGDFKVNDVSEEKTQEFKESLGRLTGKKIDILFLDSSNIREEGSTPSDNKVWGELNSIFAKTHGRVVFATFSSHLKRLEAVIEIAHAQKRPVYACGRNLVFYLRAGGIEGWTYLDRFSSEPESNAMVLVTGCEAEQYSILVRTLEGEAPFELKNNDTIIISADPIPIPEIESRVKKMVGELLKPGLGEARVFGSTRTIYINQEAPSDFPIQAKRALVHVSGHGKREDARFVINTLKPKTVIPIHGDLERRKLLASLAENEGYKAIIME